MMLKGAGVRGRGPSLGWVGTYAKLAVDSSSIVDII